MGTRRAEEHVTWTYSHAQKTRAVMGEIEVFVRKLASAIYGCAASAIAVYKIATLNHKVFDLQSPSVRLVS